MQTLSRGVWGMTPGWSKQFTKSRFQGIRLGVSGWILQPDQLNTGCRQPAGVADKAAWRSLQPHVAHDAAAGFHIATVRSVQLER